MLQMIYSYRNGSLQEDAVFDFDSLVILARAFLQ